MSAEPFAERNGWKLFQHPAFQVQFDGLVDAVEELQRRSPDDYRAHPKAKLLARILKVIGEEVPSNPDAPQYRLSDMLGVGRAHWRRAKFLQRFRLFFRFRSDVRIIVYVWMNDESTLRKAGSKSDVYELFKKKLNSGNPPDDWDDLVQEFETA